ncbi:MAG: hypothetical protein MJZ21_05865 [archaeon]|nr:hypothetical protein [archaeon]
MRTFDANKSLFSSHRLMAKITFCYDAEGFRVADMHIVIGENRLAVKDKQSVDVEVPAGEYEIMFKSSIRFTRAKFQVNGDMTIQVGWDKRSGTEQSPFRDLPDPFFILLDSGPF